MSSWQWRGFVNRQLTSRLGLPWQWRRQRHVQCRETRGRHVGTLAQAYILADLKIAMFKYLKQQRRWKKAFAHRLYVFAQLPHDKQQLLSKIDGAWGNRSRRLASLTWNMTTSALRAKFKILKHLNLRWRRLTTGVSHGALWCSKKWNMGMNLELKCSITLIKYHVFFGTCNDVPKGNRIMT